MGRYSEISENGSRNGGYIYARKRIIIGGSCKHTRSKTSVSGDGSLCLMLLGFLLASSAFDALYLIRLRSLDALVSGRKVVEGLSIACRCLEVVKSSTTSYSDGGGCMRLSVLDLTLRIAGLLCLLCLGCHPCYSWRSYRAMALSIAPIHLEPLSLDALVGRRKVVNGLSLI